MGYERYGGPLPYQQPSSFQPIPRRHGLPSRTRMVRYVLILLIMVTFICIYDRADLPPTVSRYLPIAVDGMDITVAQDKTPSTQNIDSESSQRDIPAESQTTSIIQDTGTPKPYPKFGKLTASFGDPDPPYEAAIASHALHNEIHGYPHFILREHMIRGLWSKHGYILTILGQELAKPEDQRLKWLFWHDRDTVLMNPQIPLDIFVPPEPEFSNIHMVVTKDRNGLNNGVFMMRVSQWSFKLFASALSIREYQPEIPLKYTEQSGMEEAIKRPWWANSVAYVPQRWFNGYPPSDDTSDPKNQKQASIARPGSLLIHFASNRDGLRPERMARWGDMAKNRTESAWDKPLEETWYMKEINEYWERLGKGESMDKVVNELGKRSWEEWEPRGKGGKGGKEERED